MRFFWATHANPCRPQGSAASHHPWRLGFSTSSSAGQESKEGEAAAAAAAAAAAEAGSAEAAEGQAAGAAGGEALLSLDELQKQNAELQAALEEERKKVGGQWAGLAPGLARGRQPQVNSEAALPPPGVPLPSPAQRQGGAARALRPPSCTGRARNGGQAGRQSCRGRPPTRDALPLPETLSSGLFALPGPQGEDMKDKLLRTLADMENLRDRTARVTAEAKQFATQVGGRGLVWWEVRSSLVGSGV